SRISTSLAIRRRRRRYPCRRRSPLAVAGMEGEEEENVGPFRRTSARTRRMATRMASALASSDNRAQAALARLEALESDNAGPEVVDLNDDDEYGSADEEDHVLMQRKQSKNMKRKTRQGKALEKKAARSFMDVLQEANLESLPPHVPTYSRAAVGPPSTSSRRHYCSVCGSTANYTCVRCGTRFCSCRCQVIHNDTRCLKFVA
ncbi:Os03g0367800, partial [Oryza sativa Japonica Group]